MGKIGFVDSGLSESRIDKLGIGGTGRIPVQKKAERIPVAAITTKGLKGKISGVANGRAVQQTREKHMPEFTNFSRRSR